MSGEYTYGEKEPTESCGCCGGPAYAEFCDVGVGMVQIEPYHCSLCGAVEPSIGSDWVRPPKPSERGERVTGYLIDEHGTAFETTFDDDHRELYARMRTSWSELRARGCVRITNLEGYAIELPPFMTARTRKALSGTLKVIGEDAATVVGGRRPWGPPYVLKAGEWRGAEMTHAELMSAVSRLPLSGERDSSQDLPSPSP